MRLGSQGRLRTRSFVGALISLSVLLGAAWAEQPARNTITGLEVKEAAEVTRVIVHGDAKPTFTVFKLNDPARVFIDLSNADISALKAPVLVDNGVIERITPLQFQDKVVHVARLIVTLEQDARYAVKTQGHSLVIELDAAKRTAN
ncbi:AMIN domain-containing protein, partial [Myxococcota bacterium]|nr:AMIN domain-containing protein [Myxococcota bacterium]